MTCNRVLFIVNCLEIGGAEVQVTRLAEGLAARGWKVGVVSLLSEGTLGRELVERGIEVHTLNMHPGIADPRAVFRLRRILRTFSPDVVHSHIVHANLLARITRLIAPMRSLITSAHNVQECGRWLELAYRFTDRLTDLTTNVTPVGVQRYIDIGVAPASRIRFMPNGLEVAQYSRDPRSRAQLRSEFSIGDRFAWLSVGRFREQKDYPNLMRAFAALRETERNATLIVAGTGEQEEPIKALAASLDLVEHVRFIGERRDVPQLMGMADGFVLSSAWEGMPLVLQEAAASELPVVATHVGGNSDIVQDNVSAFLVPAKDSTALAQGMRRMMRLSPQERAAMGRAGREHVEQQFGMEHVLDRWEAMYAEVAKRPIDSRPSNGRRDSLAAGVGS